MRLQSFDGMHVSLTLLPCPGKKFRPSKKLTAEKNPSCNIMYSQRAELPCFRRKIVNFYSITVTVLFHAGHRFRPGGAHVYSRQGIGLSQAERRFIPGRAQV